jgi:hypothetical protein
MLSTANLQAGAATQSTIYESRSFGFSTNTILERQISKLSRESGSQLYTSFLGCRTSPRYFSWATHKFFIGKW